MARRADSKAKARTRPTAPGTASDRDWTALVQAIGHDFADPGLLAEAMTHRSAARADAFRFGNERLEFLGDRVLGLVVAELLLAEFPDDAEGALARRFTGLVRREALEKVATGLDLGQFIVVAESEERAGARHNRSILADTCEALIGGLYLDGGLEVARRFILARWRPLLAAHGRARRDAKTQLQEWAQGRGLSLPQYREVGREGPAHAPSFTVEARVGGFAPTLGTAGSKRAAEQVAAAALLDVIATEEEAVGE